LFATFQRFHSAEEFEGTGIGLATVARAMDRQGGGVRVESAPGQGATFWITLPTVRGMEAEEPAPAQGPAGSTGAEGAVNAAILVVEDNDVNQVVLEGLLDAMGYKRVMLASDGREAVDLCARHAFDLVLMDWQMPVMDGLQAAQALRAAGHRMPIVGLTGNAGPGDRERCLAAGMNGLLAKPVEPRLLARKLERWLRRAAPPGVGPAAPAGATQVFDRVGVAERFSEDRTLFVQARAIFVRNTPARLEEIAGAQAAGDDAAMRRMAHALRGSAGTVGAGRLAALCRQLERGDWPPGSEWLPHARAAFAAFERESAD
jgi:CheY-like chemotaxis protein